MPAGSRLPQKQAVGAADLGSVEVPLRGTGILSQRYNFILHGPIRR